MIINMLLKFQKNCYDINIEIFIITKHLDLTKFSLIVHPPNFNTKV